MESTCSEDQQTAVALCACKFPLVSLCQEHTDEHLTDSSNFHFPLPLSANKVISSKEAYLQCKPWLFQLNTNYDLLREKFQSLATGEDQIESAFQTLLQSASEANKRLKAEFSLRKEAFRTEIEKAIAETRIHALEEYQSVSVLAQLLWNEAPYQFAQCQFFTFQAKCLQTNLPSTFHVALQFIPGLTSMDMGKCFTPLTDQIGELTTRFASQEDKQLTHVPEIPQQPEDVQANERLLALETENKSLKEQCKTQASQLTEYRVSLDNALKQLTKSEARVEKLDANLQSVLKKYNTLRAERKAKRKHSLLLKRGKQTHLEEYLTASNRRNAILEARLRSWGITADPNIESQEPLPDYTTPQSKAALAKFGHYSGEDDELLLVKRGPILSDDGIYIGQWNAQNERHGYGKFLRNNGDIYEGQWRHNWKTGKGRYIWANGHVYLGDFTQDKYDGFGTYYYPNGDEYSGAMANDNAEGVGSFTFGDASQKAGERYIGEFFKDKYHGLGAYFQANGFMCVGSWLSGTLNGKGLKGWTMDGSMYIGEFANGLNSGNGCYYWADGEVYHGEWKNGIRFGRGRLTRPGAFAEGVWCGHSQRRVALSYSLIER